MSGPPIMLIFRNSQNWIVHRDFIICALIASKKLCEAALEDYTKSVIYEKFRTIGTWSNTSLVSQLYIKIITERFNVREIVCLSKFQILTYGHAVRLSDFPWQLPPYYS